VSESDDYLDTLSLLFFLLAAQGAASVEEINSRLAQINDCGRQLAEQVKAAEIAAEGLVTHLTELVTELNAVIENRSHHEDTRKQGPGRPPGTEIKGDFVALCWMAVRLRNGSAKTVTEVARATWQEGVEGNSQSAVEHRLLRKFRAERDRAMGIADKVLEVEKLAPLIPLHLIQDPEIRTVLEEARQLSRSVFPLLSMPEGDPDNK
jgi:hypothetical protein